MATNFFSNSDVISYSVSDNGQFVKLTDLTKTVDITTLNESKVSYYTYYNIIDGDRPDTVSYLLYGTVQYYWTFFILNDNLKEGLHYSWPLNNVALDKMINAEYDDYSALTFVPISNGDDVTNDKSDLSMVPLNAEYLKYLLLYRVSYTDNSENAFDSNTTKYCNILKYDHNRLTTVIHNITNSSSREAFLPTSTADDTVYKLYWNNPYTQATADYNTCEAYKVQFTNSVVESFLPLETIQRLNEKTDPNTYVFGKKYTAKRASFAWALYKYAPYQYTDTDGIYANAYDIVTNSLVVDPTYISYYDKETGDNEAKSKIKAVRPDKVREFAQEYFNILNS